MSSAGVGRDVLNTQHESLDATDTYASAWSVALAEAYASSSSSSTLKVSWGGRGKGGRGNARKTFQPYDIVVTNVSLEYMNDTSVTGGGKGGSKVLLNDAYIKLLPGKVYSLIGRNGVGKSSFLKRMNAGKIPGFPPHICKYNVGNCCVSSVHILMYINFYTQITTYRTLTISITLSTTRSIWI